MQDRRCTSPFAPMPRAVRVAGAMPVRVAWRSAVLTVGAATAVFAARDAAAQTSGRTTARKGARPARVSAALPPTVADPATDSAARAGGAPGAPAHATTDTVTGDVGPLPPFVAAPGVPTTSATGAPATSTAPSAPNVPGAPNVAGRLTTSLARADVVAPLVETVAGGTGAPVLHVQVLLDAARFSPGAVSGVWNENTVFAIRAFRAVTRLPPGDSADADVIARLERIVGRRAPLTEYVVTAADVRGPYRRVPGSMYAKAKADCLCYSSMLAMLGERFHATTDVIERLNPDVDVTHAPSGTRLVVPNVERGPAPAVARLIVDKREGSIRGLDARGQTRFWLPATVGSSSLPSPAGRLRVVSTTLNPHYRYDPVVLGESRSVGPNALLPAGPNSPVGVLWAQLSRPHVGLHGTPTPEDVGYTMSHGCVRMANWDARWLTPRLQPGLVVDFQ